MYQQLAVGRADDGENEDEDDEDDEGEEEEEEEVLLAGEITFNNIDYITLILLLLPQ